MRIKSGEWGEHMTDRQITCCFTGHRSSKLPWRGNERDPRCLRLKNDIANAVRAVYESGFRHFICGMALGCDTFFAEAVIDLRLDFPDITLEAAIPCEGQDKSWDSGDKARYDRILASCDEITLVSRSYSPGCMQRRNEYMVSRSSLVIAVFNGSSGGTFNTLRLACRQGLEIIEIEP